jgi:valyl-tRNA synthetase
MSKSKDNVVTPADLLVQHGSDAVRCWAASGRPGTDTAFDVGQMKIGRRLAVRILNASKFVLSFGEVPEGAPVTEPLGQAMLAELAATIEEATAAFEECRRAAGERRSAHRARQSLTLCAAWSLAVIDVGLVLEDLSCVGASPSNQRP